MDLATCPFLFLDCQTTGLSHQKAELLEMGWSLTFREEDIQTRLIRPSSTEGVPKKVWRMTGLSPTDLENGEEATKVWETICLSVKENPVRAVVIHYSQFEMPFLRALYGKVYPETPFPWPVICTYRLAGRLHSDLPARTLRAMSGHLGFVLSEAHRSYGHVAATQRIWRHLIDSLKSQESVQTWDDLQRWLAESPKAKKKGPRKYLLARETRLDLPHGPGVYEMHSRSGSILYIGKATSLRDRVNSYFRQKRSTRAMLHELMTQVADIRVTQTETSLEAALLENDRIKEVQPQYNDSLRTYERQVLFLSRDLKEAITRPSSTHSWGPFTSLRPFESLERLYGIQKNQLEDLDLLLLNHPPEEIKKRLDDLLTELGFHDLSDLTLFDLLSAGRKKLPELKEDDEIGASIHRKLKRSVRLLHHPRWLCWLMESRVAWEIPKDPENRWRFITLSAGRIIECGYVKPEGLGQFPRRRVRFRDRQALMNVTTFDRMRILLTELASLAKRGVGVKIQFSSTRVYETSFSPGWFANVVQAMRLKELHDSPDPQQSGTSQVELA